MSSFENQFDPNYHYGTREEIRTVTFFKDLTLLEEDLDALRTAGLR